MTESRHIIVENSYEKEKCIALIEGNKCLSCDSDNIRIVKEPIHGTFKNHYYCKDCGTEWYGNVYDNTTYEAVSETNGLFDMGNIIYIAVALIFVACLVICPAGAIGMTITGIGLGAHIYRRYKDSVFLKISIACLVIAILFIFF